MPVGTAVTRELTNTVSKWTVWWYGQADSVRMWSLGKFLVEGQEFS